MYPLLLILVAFLIAAPGVFASPAGDLITQRNNNRVLAANQGYIFEVRRIDSILANEAASGDVFRVISEYGYMDPQQYADLDVGIQVAAHYRADGWTVTETRYTDIEFGDSLRIVITE